MKINLIYAFFKTWADWPEQAPVILTDSIPGEHGARLSYSELTSFNNAVMAIVSPCYPVSNAAIYVE